MSRMCILTDTRSASKLASPTALVRTEPAMVNVLRTRLLSSSSDLPMGLEIMNRQLLPRDLLKLLTGYHLGIKPNIYSFMSQGYNH